MDQLLVGEDPESGEEGANDAYEVDVKFTCRSVCLDSLWVAEHASDAADSHQETNDLQSIRLVAAAVTDQDDENAEHSVADVGMGLD